MEGADKLKRAVITGAALAIKHKEKDPRATESQIMQNIIKDMRKILANID